MKLDEAAVKMAYEAAREEFFQLLPDAPFAHAPRDLPCKLREAYQSGYERGHRNAMEFDPVDLCNPPAELDGEFARAWELGYAHGTTDGTIHSQPLWARIGREIKKSSLI